MKGIIHTCFDCGQEITLDEEYGLEKDAMCPYCLGYLWEQETDNESSKCKGKG
jgi:hypothetical protein